MLPGSSCQVQGKQHPREKLLLEKYLFRNSFFSQGVWASLPKEANATDGLQREAHPDGRGIVLVEGDFWGWLRFWRCLGWVEPMGGTHGWDPCPL